MSKKNFYFTVSERDFVFNLLNVFVQTCKEKITDDEAKFLLRLYNKLDDSLR